MKISPNLGEVQKIAATGQYNVLPVSCEILSDFTTPIETLKIADLFSKGVVAADGVDLLPGVLLPCPPPCEIPDGRAGPDSGGRYPDCS